MSFYGSKQKLSDRNPFGNTVSRHWQLVVILLAPSDVKDDRLEISDVFRRSDDVLLTTTTKTTLVDTDRRSNSPNYGDSVAVLLVFVWSAYRNLFLTLSPSFVWSFSY